MNDRFGWSCGEGQPPLIVGPPGNGGAASFGNGTMIGFRAATRALVRDAHAAGLAAGGTTRARPARARPPAQHLRRLSARPQRQQISIMCNAPGE